MRRKFFTGTKDKKETLRIAMRLEDEQHLIRLNPRLAPSPFDKYKSEKFVKIAGHYLAWGNAKGGRGGRPWGRRHQVERRRLLKWWGERLNLETLGDLEGVLPRVDQVMRELEREGLAGKTMQTRIDTISSFCKWCIGRGYLKENPIKGIGHYDFTPKFRRRALSPEEVHRLLPVCKPFRRLLYEVAICTGLRAGELRALERRHLDVDRCGIHLDPGWTKNRKPGFQPLPAYLIQQLVDFHATGDPKYFYIKYRTTKRRWTTGTQRANLPLDPLLYVSANTGREFVKDLERAGIPKEGPGGKLDFHALRVTYTTFLFDVGASLKEAQHLARHSDPNLTANIYARVRDERLHWVTEKVADIIKPKPPEDKSGSSGTETVRQGEVG
ncbi:MAG: tyrosine-type recombinase/integrase [Planctomycetota bacterium]|nr:tyrosine-type recombinase/integrase [Planctomycetota bacterium]